MKHHDLFLHLKSKEVEEEEEEEEEGSWQLEDRTADVVAAAAAAYFRGFCRWKGRRGKRRRWTAAPPTWFLGDVFHLAPARMLPHRSVLLLLLLFLLLLLLLLLHILLHGNLHKRKTFFLTAFGVRHPTRKMPSDSCPHHRRLQQGRLR